MELLKFRANVTPRLPFLTENRDLLRNYPEAFGVT